MLTHTRTFTQQGHWRHLSIFLTAVVFCLSFPSCAGKREAHAEIVPPYTLPNQPAKPLIPGDTVEITVFNQPDLTRKMKIAPDGTLSYPLLGDVRAAGLRPSDLRKNIQTGLQKYVRNPDVMIDVTPLYGRVVILGEVDKPGAYEIQHPVSTAEAISLAGGFTQNAQKDNVLYVTGYPENPKLRKLQIKKALVRTDVNALPYLEPGDVLYVPTSIIGNIDTFFIRVQHVIQPYYFYILPR